MSNSPLRKIKRQIDRSGLSLYMKLKASQEAHEKHLTIWQKIKRHLRREHKLYEREMKDLRAVLVRKGQLIPTKSEAKEMLKEKIAANKLALQQLQQQNDTGKVRKERESKTIK